MHNPEARAPEKTSGFKSFSQTQNGLTSDDQQEKQRLEQHTTGGGKNLKDMHLPLSLPNTSIQTTSFFVGSLHLSGSRDLFVWQIQIPFVGEEKSKNNRNTLNF